MTIFHRQTCVYAAALFPFLLAEAKVPLSQPTLEGSREKLTIALIVVGVLVIVLVTVILICCGFFRHQRRQIKEYRSQFFPVIFEHYGTVLFVYSIVCLLFFIYIFLDLEIQSINTN